MSYIIGEAGTGHRGNETDAAAFIDSASGAGADAIKFQMFVPDEPLFCPLEGDEKRIPRWNDTALTFRQWQNVKSYADHRKIDFLASVFQPTGIEWLKELQPKYYKVASRAAKTYPYDQVPGPFIVSNGLFDLLDGDMPKGRYLLDCRMQYPTSLCGAAWREYTDGLSDHSGTPWPAMDAMARGAKFIEVHFGDKEGPDGPVNLTTDQLKLICEFRDALAEMREG